MARLLEELKEAKIKLSDVEAERDNFDIDCSNLHQQNEILEADNEELKKQIQQLLAENEGLKAQVQQSEITTATATVPLVEPDPEDKLFQQLNLLAPETAKSEQIESLLPDIAEQVDANSLTTNTELASEAVASEPQHLNKIEFTSKTTYTASQLLKAKKQLIQKQFGNKINEQKLRDWHCSALRGDSGKDNLASLSVKALPRGKDGKILFVDLEPK